MQKAVAVAGIAAAILAGCAGARGEDGGPTVERNYQVGPFERIEVAGSYDVDVRTGSGQSVRASGPERSIDRLVVEVEGDTLMIHPKKRGGFSFGWSDKHGPVRVAVTVPNLRGAEIAGSGGITVDRVTGDSFEGGIAGSGDLRLGQVEVGRLKMGIAGSGEIRASGRARSAEYEIAGSGDIDAAGVTSEEAKVSIAGSGNVEANATGTASVDIAGSGDVRLTGGAQCKVSKAGSGDVHCG